MPWLPCLATQDIYARFTRVQSSCIRRTVLQHILGRDSAKARDGMCGHSSPGPFRCTYTTTSPESSSFRKRGPSPLVALHSFPRPSKLLFAPPVPLFTRPLQSPNSFFLRRRQRKTLAYLTKKLGHLFSQTDWISFLLLSVEREAASPFTGLHIPRPSFERSEGSEGLERKPEVEKQWKG